jgi:uncharacterized membrane protein SpoIIM required for sporulation
MRPPGKPRWEELTRLVDRADRKGLRALSVEEVKQLCRLYRQVTIDLSRARTDGADPDLIRYLNFLAARAHGQVYMSRRVDVRQFFGFAARGFPRVVRRRARPLLAAVGVFLLSGLFSALAVVRSPQLAYSLFDEQVVEMENLRLERQEGEYRGNFTFPLSSSPLVAVGIILNNVKVAILAFALGALGCLPGVLLLLYNGRMLGTLTGLVAIHGFAGDFYALILTHGVLELSAICIAGGAGFVIGWALVAPGELSRREALRQAAPDAFALLAGATVLLVIAGHIEAYVTPHFPQPIRWCVAIISGVCLAGYLLWGSREAPAPTSARRMPSSPLADHFNSLIRAPRISTGA